MIVIFNFIDTGELDYGGYVLPGWAHAIGWMVAVIPIVLIPVYAVLVYIYDVMCYPDSEESILEVRERIPALRLYQLSSLLIDLRFQFVTLLPTPSISLRVLLETFKMIMIRLV